MKCTNFRAFKSVYEVIPIDRLVESSKISDKKENIKTEDLIEWNDKEII